MKKSRSRKSRLRRWTERFLLLAGLAGVGIWAWSNFSTSVYQDWQSWAFDRQVRGERATIPGYLSDKAPQLLGPKLRAWLKIPDTPKPSDSLPDTVPPPDRPPSPPNNGIVGRLAIPRLHMSAMVREGVGEDTLGLALGHIPSTALPGQKGNIGVAGHRDTLFRRLREIHVNDVIRFETLSGNHVYRVQNTEIVTPKDVSVLNAGQYPELTLVTCYPFYYVGSAPDRFIVKAREVSATANAIEKPPKPPETRRPAVEHPAESLSAKASKGRRPETHPGIQRFEVIKSHSRQLAPGISMALTRTDLAYRRVDGWIWVMPDRRTIWLRGQRAHEPLVFYRDGRRRELMITKVSANSVSGYVLGPGNMN